MQNHFGEGTIAKTQCIIFYDEQHLITRSGQSWRLGILYFTRAQFQVSIYELEEFLTNKELGDY